jgi:hypothetical protein
MYKVDRARTRPSKMSSGVYFYMMRTMGQNLTSVDMEFHRAMHADPQGHCSQTHSEQKQIRIVCIPWAVTIFRPGVNWFHKFN